VVENASGKHGTLNKAWEWARSASRAWRRFSGARRKVKRSDAPITCRQAANDNPIGDAAGSNAIFDPDRRRRLVEILGKIVEAATRTQAP
jgi:hypothetical protein